MVTIMQTGTKVTLSELMADPDKPLKSFNPHCRRIELLIKVAQNEAMDLDGAKADNIELFMYEGGEWAYFTLTSWEGAEVGIDEYTAAIDFTGRTGKDGNRWIVNEILRFIRCARGLSERQYRQTIYNATANALTAFPEQTASIMAFSAAA